MIPGATATFLSAPWSREIAVATEFLKVTPQYIPMGKAAAGIKDSLPDLLVAGA